MRADAQAHPIISHIGRGTQGFLRGVAGHRGNREPALRTARRCISQVPNPAMHAGAHRRRPCRADPIRRNQFSIDLLLRKWRRVGARNASHHTAARVENLNRHGAGGIVSEVVIDHRTVRRISSRRFIRLDRRIAACAAPRAYRGRRLEQRRLVRCENCSELLQRTDVIQHPKGAAVRGDDEIPIVDRQVAHRGVRQIELQ